MLKIPPHIQSLKPFKPGKTGPLNLETLQEQVILCSNENNFGPSPLAMKAMIEAIPMVNLYPDPTALELKKLLAIKHDVALDQLSVSNGSDSLLFNVIRAFVLPGENIVTSEASFVSAKVMARMNNIELIEVPVKDVYRFDLDAIFSAINENTRMIYIVNPNNPTGTKIDAKELKAFLDKIPNHILVLIDEAYYEFAIDLDPDFPESHKFEFEHVISLRTFSKAYGLAGVRVGYAIGPTYLIEALNKVKLIFEPNFIAQVGAIAALHDHQFLHKAIENNTEQLPKVALAVRNMGFVVTESYGNFIMMDCGSDELARYLTESLANKNILVRKLDSFGVPNAIRISIGRPEQNDFMLKTLKEIIDAGLPVVI